MLADGESALELVSTKIKSVEALKVSIPLERPARFATRVVSARDYTVVKVDTDEGLTGYGLCWWNHPADVVTRHLAHHLVGRDPLNIERLWDAMYREIYRERKGAAVCALSAVDIALWDIKCKRYAQPLHGLLGSFRDKVPCYASDGYYRTGEGVKELVEEIGHYVKMGFRAAKIKVGAIPLDEDVKRVKAIRDAFGYDLKLMVDANNGYDRAQAIAAGREYEKFKVEWFEEPIWPDDLDGAAAVCQALDTPVAQGELEYTKYGFRDIVMRGAADILQPDVLFCGGITEFLKIAHLAEACNLPVAPHAEHDIHAQLVATIPNALTVEYFEKESDVMKDSMLYESTLVPRDGYLELPSVPGVGLPIDEGRVQEFLIKSG